MERIINNFQFADYLGREEIVEDFLGNFKRTWPQDGEEFPQPRVEAVSSLLVTLTRPHIFLAYLAAPLCQNKTCNGDTLWYHPSSDVRRYARMLFTHWSLPLKYQGISSQDAALTDKHASILKKCTSRLWGANTDDREELIMEATDHIKRTWGEAEGGGEEARGSGEEAETA